MNLEFGGEGGRFDGQVGRLGGGADAAGVGVEPLLLVADGALEFRRLVARPVVVEGVAGAVRRQRLLRPVQHGRQLFGGARRALVVALPRHRRIGQRLHLNSVAQPTTDPQSVFLSSHSRFRVLLGLHQISQNCIKFHSFLPSFATFYLVLPSFTGFYLVLHGYNLQSFTGL